MNKLQKIYNDRRDLEIKLSHLMRKEDEFHNKRKNEDLYYLVTDTRKRLKEMDKKIEFIETLLLEMEANEMFYSKKNIKSKNVL